MINLNEIKIRELNTNDVQGFLELKKIGLSTDPYSFLADLEDDSLDYPKEVEERIAKASIQNGDIILGAFADSLIGIVAVTRNRNKKRNHKADLHGMYIKPEYRGIGLGKELLNKVLAKAKKMAGIEEIELIVASHNESVVGLYEKVGFSKTYFETHALKIDNKYIDAYHMKKEMRKE